MFQFLLLVFGLLYEVVLDLHNRQKYKKIRQTRSFVLVQYDQCADDARHPSGAGEDEDDEHGPAPAVDDGQRREKDGEEDTKYGHGGLFFEGFQCAAELVGAGGGLASAADAVEFWDDVVDFLSDDQPADALEVSVASAIKEDLLDDAVVIDGHIDELRAGALGFVEGVGHRLRFLLNFALIHIYWGSQHIVFRFFNSVFGYCFSRFLKCCQNINVS